MALIPREDLAELAKLAGAAVRQLAADRQQTVLLDDDDGMWLVAPDGQATRYVPTS